MLRNLNRIALVIALAAAALLVAACGTGAGKVSTDTPETPEDTTGDTIIGNDAGEPDAPAGDAQPDQYADGAGDSGPQPGAFGWPCDDPEDCDSGYCILTGEKKICTMTCVEECPADFVCAPVSTTPPDVTYLCLPRFDKVCQPCVDHAECQPILGGSVDLCLDYGDAGSFCGADCSDDTCPAGYGCVTAEAPDGTSVKQCRLTEGACQCTALSKFLQLTTECAESNDAGTCAGERYCGPTGLTACDAPSPATETCNSLDDDCNGAIDDITAAECLVTSEYGTCPGTKACSLGDEICQGASPEPEICDGKDNNCNGFTDEGYTDTDDDGQRDCIDDDDDGDGIPDAMDNCPLMANPDTLDTDLDGQGNACDPDDDNDGVGDAADCAPLDAAIHPGAAEICDGKDNDCDGPTDEGSCDDGNYCTDDVCDPALGCQNVFNAAPCSDANPCTTNDHCAFGACTGEFIDCEDANPCTINSCDPLVGCTFTYGAGACDDGNPCTINDICGGNGVCGGEAIACDCNADTDCLLLDDGNVCNGSLYCSKISLPYKCMVDPASVIDCDLPPDADPTCAQATCNPRHRSLRRRAQERGRDLRRRGPLHGERRLRRRRMRRPGQGLHRRQPLHRRRLQPRPRVPAQLQRQPLRRRQRLHHRRLLQRRRLRRRPGLALQRQQPLHQRLLRSRGRLSVHQQREPLQRRQRLHHRRPLRKRCLRGHGHPGVRRPQRLHQ
ncbi:MAG: MopE-related protein [Pseudomonadota bacterium]